MTEPTPDKDNTPPATPDAQDAQAKASSENKASDRPANRRQFFALLAGLGIDQMEQKNAKAKSLLDRFLYPEEEKNSRNEAPSVNPVDAGEPDDDAWYRDRLALEQARQALWEDDEDEEDDGESGLIEEEDSAALDHDLPLLTGPVESVSRGSSFDDDPEDLTDPAHYIAPEDDDAEEDPVRD